MIAKRILVTVIGIFVIIGLLPACHSASVAKLPAKFIVTRMEIAPNETAAGETVNIHAEISNIGGLADNYTAILYIDDLERKREIIPISCNETKKLDWQLSESKVGQHTVKLGSIIDLFWIVEPKQVKPEKETVPDDSYVQVNVDGWSYNQALTSCFYYISVHNKHEKWSLRNVKVILPGQEYVIADLIKPFDTATFEKPSLPCSYNVTWTWQPPAESQ